MVIFSKIFYGKNYYIAIYPNFKEKKRERDRKKEKKKHKISLEFKKRKKEMKTCMMFKTKKIPIRLNWIAESYNWYKLK